jgi:NADPH2:quinone reductase
MKAIQYTKHGGYEVLQLIDKQATERQAGETLVQVTTAAVNVGDNIIRYGYFPGTPLPMIPGFEGVGCILDSGDSGLKKGTRVMFTGPMGIYRDGTWQEQVSIPANLCVPVPEVLSDHEAAGFPIAYLTAYLSLIAGGFKPGKRVLAAAVGGAVGNAAVQLADAIGAAKVITTAGSTEKAKHALELGYSNVIDLSKENLNKRILELTSGEGVDIILDGIGSNFTNKAVQTLAKGGTHVIYGGVAGGETTINVFDLIFKGSKMIGFASLVAQPIEDIANAYTVLLELVGRKAIRPVVAKAFPLEEAAKAQRYLAERRPFGKVLLDM